jgi:16S rRNA (guanine966-N2)-methyltransferase
MKKADHETITLRIIAGHLRSRRFEFACDPRTRPMKDRTREAVMNLLGGTLENRLAFDLFGGSGVLAFESISRGAEHAWVWEILKPGARVIRRISEDLGIADQVDVLDQDVIRWSESLADGLESHGGKFAELGANTAPWVVICCPPYAMWESHKAELTELVHAWATAAPLGSLFAVELEQNTELGVLPAFLEWQVRRYAPAQVAIAEVLEKGVSQEF